MNPSPNLIPPIAAQTGKANLQRRMRACQIASGIWTDCSSVPHTMISKKAERAKAAHAHQNAVLATIVLLASAPCSSDNPSLAGINMTPFSRDVGSSSDNESQYCQHSRENLPANRFGACSDIGD